MEVGRHGIQANIQFRLSIWMLALLAADSLYLRWMDKGRLSEGLPLHNLDR
jgi:hypothetical protein